MEYGMEESRMKYHPSISKLNYSLMPSRLPDNEVEEAFG